MRQNMDLGDVAGGIRRRWWLVMLLAVLGASAGYYTAANVPVIYRAEATILVGPTDGAVTHSSTIRASEDLAAFYADMARRQLVLDPVVRRLGLDGTWADLRDEVSAQVPAQNLRLVTVTVLGDEQGATEDIADAIVEQLVALSPAAPDGNEQAFVNQQVDDLKNSIEQAEQRINELESRIDQTTDESARDTMHDQIAALQAQVSDWQTTYVDLVGVEPSSDAGGLQVLDEAVPVTDKDRSGQVKQAAVGGLAGGVLGMLLAWLLHRRHARRVQRWNAEREAAIEAAAVLESAGAPVAEDRLVSNGHAVPGTVLGAPAVNGQLTGQVGNGQVANGHNGARHNGPGPDGAARNGTARNDSGNVRPMSGKSKGGRR